MKLMTVVGARPQFIKAAALSRLLRREHEEILVHTGQHYDANMSGVFFAELDIPRPDINLGIAGGSHAQMTGRMLMALEERLLAQRPDALLVYGDTNSTLAAALAAVKQGIPVLHVEAGNRAGLPYNPEEINRVCTDHVSALLFACTQSALDNLLAENLGRKAHLVGDPMYDAFCYYRERLANGRAPAIEDFEGKAMTLPEKYYYLTCHREENTRTGTALREILSAMEALDAPVVYPLHPRNREMALALRAQCGFTNTVMIPAVGYLASLSLVCGAQRVITDSGGVQREAFFARRPCVTIVDAVIWPETMTGNCNQLAKPEKADILEKLSATPRWPMNRPFGDGHAGERICGILRKWAEENSHGRH